MRFREHIGACRFLVMAAAVGGLVFAGARWVHAEDTQDNAERIATPPSQDEQRRATELTEQLNGLTIRVATLSRELEQSRAKGRANAASLAGIERDLTSISGRREVLRLELSAHQEALAREEAREEGAVRELDALSDEVRTRLRALYMARRGGAEDLLVFHQRERDVALFSPREHAMWGRIVNSDRDLLVELEKKKEEVSTLRQRLNRERATLVSLKTTIEKQAEELEKKKTVRSSMLSHHEAHEASVRRTLESLQEEWFRLSRMLEVLTGGGAEPTSQMVVPPIGGTYQSSGKVADVPTVSISIPAIGRIVRPFGKRQVREFDDFVSANGVELLVEEGGIVKGVQAGTVRFVGEMPGFGPVVVIDHGDRFYSMYGRLGRVAVAVGSRVEKGGEIGIVGKPGARGSNFYFESRRAGHPVDPVRELGVPWG